MRTALNRQVVGSIPTASTRIIHPSGRCSFVDFFDTPDPPGALKGPVRACERVWVFVPATRS